MRGAGDERDGSGTRRAARQRGRPEAGSCRCARTCVGQGARRARQGEGGRGAEKRQGEAEAAGASCRPCPAIRWQTGLRIGRARGCGRLQPEDGGNQAQASRILSQWTPPHRPLATRVTARGQHPPPAKLVRDPAPSVGPGGRSHGHPVPGADQASAPGRRAVLSIKRCLSQEFGNRGHGFQWGMAGAPQIPGAGRAPAPQAGLSETAVLTRVCAEPDRQEALRSGGAVTDSRRLGPGRGREWPGAGQRSVMSAEEG